MSQPKPMLGDRPVIIRRTPYQEFRMGLQNCPESQAYYTDTLEDALGTARLQHPTSKIFFRGKQLWPQPQQEPLP